MGSMFYINFSSYCRYIWPKETEARDLGVKLYCTSKCTRLRGSNLASQNHLGRCWLGWCDLVLFCDFQKTTGFCWSGIFLIVQFQKIGEFRASRMQSFHFQRITKSTLKINFFWKFAETFLKHQRTVAKKKIRNSTFKFFFFSKFVCWVSHHF